MYKIYFSAKRDLTTSNSNSGANVQQQANKKKEFFLQIIINFIIIAHMNLSLFLLYT